MSFDLPALGEAVAKFGTVVRVLVTRTAGSVPRNAGTDMLVWAGGQQGTIGGGALEFEAVQAARGMLSGDAGVRAQTLPLGPGLGQCCGGSVTLFWERFAQGTLPVLPYARPIAGRGQPMPPRVAARVAALRPGSLPVEVEGWLIEAPPLPRQPLWIHGAGHVGRALVEVLAPMPGLAITWVDQRDDSFPAVIPATVTPVAAADPAAMVRFAPKEADHLILTHSHEVDLAICHALLLHGFGTAGLIGSATKWARFRTRLSALGHTTAQISAIACPIGDPALGKHPQAIAVGVAVGLLKPKAMAATKGDRVG